MHSKGLGDPVERVEAEAQAALAPLQRDGEDRPEPGVRCLTPHLTSLDPADLDHPASFTALPPHGPLQRGGRRLAPSAPPAVPGAADRA